MAKIDCYYIGKSNKIETPIFSAYKYKDKETKETTLYPIIDKNSNKVFICGVGWKKISKSKLVEVPVFDGEEEHWNEYIEKYGVYCLYYSLEGEEYDFYNCSTLPKATEIRSIIHTGVKGYAKFMKLYHKMNELQKKVIEEKYINDINYHSVINIDTNKYLFTPKYYEIYTFIPTTYQPDILKDESRINCLWEDYRSGFLKQNSKKYQEYLSLEKKRQNIVDKKIKAKDNDTFLEIEKDYLKIDGLTYKTFIEANKEIHNIIHKELFIDNGAFSMSLKDKIKFIYGEEVSNIYNELVDKYLKVKE